MPFPTMTFAQLIQMLAAQYSAQADQPANTNQGSSLGSIFNAVGLLALNAQNELVYVDEVTRMLTSTGTDIDTWGAQYNIPRIQAAASVGSELFTLPAAATAPVPIPVGGIVQTAGGLQFVVIPPVGPSDPNYAAFSALNNAYMIQTGNISGAATVQCTATGVIGNVSPGAISLTGATATSPPLTGFLSVANPLQFNNGTPAESDTAYQIRLTLSLSTGSCATDNATGAAITSVQAGLTYAIADGFNATGTPVVGGFAVIVGVANQGAAPSAALVAEVTLAVAAARAAGIKAFVAGATPSTVNVSAYVHVAAGFNPTTVLQGANLAVQTYLNSIGLDPAGGIGVAQYSEVYVIIRTYPGVANCTNVLINGGAADVSAAAFYDQLVAGTVTLNTY